MGDRFLMCLLCALLAGCGGMLPSGKAVVRSPWNTFDEAKTAFDQVVPDQTTGDELKALGFDPFSTPNISILNYLDIMRLFNYDPAYEHSLDQGIRACFAVKSSCYGFDVNVSDIDKQRIGNFWADTLNFKRKTKETGWRFRALILLQDGHVIYKMWSGSPITSEYNEKSNPLGPLQDIGSSVIKDSVN